MWVVKVEMVRVDAIGYDGESYVEEFKKTDKVGISNSIMNALEVVKVETFTKTEKVGFLRWLF